MTVPVIISWSYFIFASIVLRMSEQRGTDLTCNSVMNSGSIIAILIYIPAKVQPQPQPCHGLVVIFFISFFFCSEKVTVGFL